MALNRLDKLIALNCNVSRKEARELVKSGKVKVNGIIVLRSEELIDTSADNINVNGYEFSSKNHIVIMMNKPDGVITATKDESKKTVIDLIPENLMRRSLFPCGRLDKNTEGLLIITDDGELCHKIVSPVHHVYKTYVAALTRPLDSNAIRILENGVTLSDGTQCLPAKVKYNKDDYGYYCEIKIREGKYHQVKRMFLAVGNHVDKLKRTAIGSLRLDDSLAPGECREMTHYEISLLFEEDG